MTFYSASEIQPSDINSSNSCRERSLRDLAFLIFLKMHYAVMTYVQTQVAFYQHMNVKAQRSQSYPMKLLPPTENGIQ